MRSATRGWLVAALALAACGSTKEGSTCATANYAATATTLELSFQTGTIVPVTPTYVFQLQ